MTNEVFSCREISAGIAEGEALISDDRILFYHADFASGTICESGHSLNGVCVKDKILIFPGGKGSSVVQMDGMYKLEKNHAAPRAFIVQEPDTVLVSCTIVMGVPMVDRAEKEFYSTVKNGDYIRVDTQKQTIEILRRAQKE